jgi:hypothetical protein
MCDKIKGFKTNATGFASGGPHRKELGQYFGSCLHPPFRSVAPKPPPANLLR